MLGLNIQNFWRFAPNETGFCNFDHISLPEIREEISICLYRVGEEIKVFGQNIYPRVFDIEVLLIFISISSVNLDSYYQCLHVVC